MRNDTKEKPTMFLALVLLAAYIVSVCSIAFAEEEPVIATVYVSSSVTSYLRGRSKPDTNSGIEARFTAGDSLEVVEFKGEWVRVIGGESETVWVKSEFVTASAPHEEPQQWFVVGNGRVHVRNAPDGEHVRWANVGDAVIVHGWIGKWAETNNGFINGDFLSKTEEDGR